MPLMISVPVATNRKYTLHKLNILPGVGGPYNLPRIFDHRVANPRFDWFYCDMPMVNSAVRSKAH